MASLGNLIGAFSSGLTLEARTTTLSGFTLDSSSDTIALRFQAETADAITGVAIHIDRVDGTPPTYKIGLQSLDSNGLPSGTYVGGGSEASTTFTPVEADQDTLKTITFDNSYTPSIGEELAVVIEYSSGTIDTSNDIIINYGTNGFEAVAPAACYSTNGGTSWTEQVARSMVSIVTAGGNYGWQLLTAGNNVTTSTSGHRHAARFTLPSGTMDSYALAGIVAWIDGGPLTVGVWDGTTLMDSKAVTLHTDSTRGGLFLFDSHVSLTPGTEYRIGAEHTGNNFSVPENDCDTAAIAAGVNGGNGQKSTFDGSSWTDDDTMLPYIWPIFADFTSSGGGGGGGYPRSRIVNA